MAWVTGGQPVDETTGRLGGCRLYDRLQHKRHRRRWRRIKHRLQEKCLWWHAAAALTTAQQLSLRRAPCSLIVSAFVRYFDRSPLNETIKWNCSGFLCMCLSMCVCVCILYLLLLLLLSLQHIQIYAKHVIMQLRTFFLAEFLLFLLLFPLSDALRLRFLLLYVRWLIFVSSTLK